MDKDASPALADLLAKGELLDKMPEPALSLAVVRPETIGPLLMLWTAPPPARECHECGCC